MIFLYIYAAAGVFFALLIAGYIRYKQYKVDQRRGYDTDPGKHMMGYLLAASVAIPIINLYWAFSLLRFFWDELKKPCYPQ